MKRTHSKNFHDVFNGQAFVNKILQVATFSYYNIQNEKFTLYHFIQSSSLLKLIGKNVL